MNYLYIRRLLGVGMLALAALHPHGAAAQSPAYIDGQSANAGGLLSDWTQQGWVTSTGTYTTAGSTGAPDMFGVYEHRGPSGTGTSSTLRNDGTYDATDNGRNYFLGFDGAPSQQGIGGSTRPRFGELFLQNGGVFNITNANGIYVDDAITYGNAGFLTTTDRTAPVAGSIFMSALATQDALGTFGNTHYVDGYVTRLGGTAFDFPVGNVAANGPSFRRLSTGANTGNPTNSAISVAQWNSDPATTTDPTDGSTHARGSGQMSTFNGITLLSVTPRTFWDFEYRTGVTGNDNTGIGVHEKPVAAIPVSVSIPDMTGLGGYPAGDMVLVGWDATGSRWIALNTARGTVGGTNAEGDVLTGTIPAGMDITAISIGSVTFPLPVTLTDFAAAKQGNRGLLSWKTASETNSSHFEVERSADGRTYTSIGRVTAAGNSTTERSYTLTDAATLTGANYYRLRMVDRDGTVKYSAIRLLNFGGKAVIVMFPNPAVNSTTLTGVEAGMRVILSDGQGRRIREERVSGNTHSLSVAGLARGVYQVQVLDAKGAVVSVLKLNKQ